MSNQRRVVITGMVAVTAFGRGVTSTWRGILEGRSGISARHPFGEEANPVQVGGYVDLACLGMGDEEDGLGRAARFGLAAGVDAFADAGLDDSTADRTSIGVCLGASTFPVIEDRLDRLGDLLNGPRWNTLRYAELCRERPWLLSQSDTASISSLLSDRLGLEGPSVTVQAACTSATQAIGHAFHALRSGQGKVMLAGGTDSMLSMLCVTGFTLLGSLAQRWTSPAQASRPFDRTRDGFVLAEGAAVLVLEDLEHAQARGARIYAELLGYGSSCDAYRFTDMQPEGMGAVGAMCDALRDAGGVRPEKVDYLNAHGTATPLNDRIETTAIRQVFGDHARSGLAVSSTKSQLGHLLCAAGAVELMVTVLSLYEGVLPPTMNLEHPDPECDLDYVPGKARKADVRVAMSNSFGFGGQNGSLLVGRWQPQRKTGVPQPARTRRVCITGLGVCSPLGLDAITHRAAWQEGRDGTVGVATEAMQSLGIAHAGRVTGFDPQHSIGNRMLRKILTPSAGFAVSAAGEALRDAGLTESARDEAALYVGSLGLDQDLDTFAEALHLALEPDKTEARGRFSFARFRSHGMSRIDPLFLVKSLPNAGLCGIAIEYGLRGSNLNIMNGATSGLLAISAASDAILRGETSVALAGGYDSQFQLEHVLADLDAGRIRLGCACGEGYLPGEGAVFFVLEELERARQRGAHVLAEVLGSAVTHSAAGDAEKAIHALERAAREAGATFPDAVFGDGLHLTAHDALESEVARRMAGDRGNLPFFATVHRLGFAGAVTGLFSLLHAAWTLDGQLAQDRAQPREALVWTSDRGRDHVAVTLRGLTPPTEAAV